MRIIFVFAAFIAVSGMAAESSWTCDALGYDPQMGYRLVMGFPKATEEDARQSAILSCMASGLIDCQVSLCSEDESR